MLTAESRWLNDDQRSRAREVMDFRNAGKQVGWNHAAATFMGFWALREGLWWALGWVLWSSKWTYAVLLAFVALVFVLPQFVAVAWLGVFLYVSYISGRYGNELKYIIKGGEPALTDGRSSLWIWVIGWYFLTWGIVLMLSAASVVAGSHRDGVVAEWICLLSSPVVFVVGIGLLLGSSRAVAGAFICTGMVVAVVLVGVCLDDELSPLAELGSRLKWEMPMIGFGPPPFIAAILFLAIRQVGYRPSP